MDRAFDNGRDCKQVKDDVNRVKNAIIRYGVQYKQRHTPNNLSLYWIIISNSLMFGAALAGVSVDSILHFM